MSDKIKKSSENISFSLSRWFRKVSTTAPSAFIITVVVVAYAIFLFSGGLYALINYRTIQPSAYINGQFFFLYPQLSGQFISDTIIAVVLYGLGFAGIFFVYQSAKSAYKPRQAYMMLVIGVAFLLISYLFLEASVMFKSSYGSG
jgi:hypothetical protein